MYMRMKKEHDSRWKQAWASFGESAGGTLDPSKYEDDLLQNFVDQQRSGVESTHFISAEPQSPGLKRFSKHDTTVCPFVVFSHAAGLLFTPFRLYCPNFGLL